MSKQIIYGEEGRARLKAGIEQLARAVKATMGPSGKTVLLQKSWGGPTVTKDGVSVSKEIELADPFENMAASLVHEAANKTSKRAGDGTTTATVLAEAIFCEGLKALGSGVNPVRLKHGIDAATAAAVESVASLSKPVKGRDEIAQVGAVSANNDPAIGDLLAEAVEKVGKDGVITVDEGKATETTLDVVDGMQFDKGFISPYFITDPTEMECVLEDALVLIHEKKISDVRDLIPVLEQAAQTGKPLLIVAENVEAEALAALVVNKLRGVLKVCAVKAPGFGERRKAMLQDIAVLTGGTAIMEDLGLKLETVTLEQLGQVSSITIDKDNTTLVGGGGKKSAIQARISQVRSALDKSTSDYDKEKLAERLAKLSGGIAVVRVGGATEIEVKERKMRVEDALHATRAAVEEGIVPGGGVALLRSVDAVRKLKLKGDAEFGVRIIEKALTTPTAQIAENAGRDGRVVVEMVREAKTGHGFNGLTGEIEDMFAAGIVDPAKVVRIALQNAASVAGTLLTSNALVTDLEEKEEAVEGAVS